MTTVSLKQILMEIQNAPNIEQTDTSNGLIGVIHSIEKAVDLFLIKRKTIEIDPEDMLRLQEDRDYRIMVRAYLSICPGYDKVDASLLYANCTIREMETKGIKAEDCVKLITAAKGFKYLISPEPRQLYSVFEDFRNKCDSRNDFYGYLEKWKKNLKITKRCNKLHNYDVVSISDYEILKHAGLRYLKCLES